MRNITHLVIHCTATAQGKEVSVKEIDRWHRARGFRCIGYHYIIHLDGKVSIGRPESEAGAHVEGHNSTSIGISYVGGVDANDVNKAVDTRTPAQKEALLKLLRELKGRYPKAVIQGHRDFPKVAKACPCFNAKAEYANLSAVTAPAPAPAEDVLDVTRIVKGDTLYGLARQFKTTVAKIRALNPGIDAANLQVGQIVRLR